VIPLEQAAPISVTKWEEFARIRKRLGQRVKRPNTHKATIPESVGKTCCSLDQAVAGVWKPCRERFSRSRGARIPGGGRAAAPRAGVGAACLLPAAAPAFPLACWEAPCRRVGRERHETKRCLLDFSEGEASGCAGPRYPSSFLSGNLSPGYLLNVL